MTHQCNYIALILADASKQTRPTVSGSNNNQDSHLSFTLGMRNTTVSAANISPWTRAGHMFLQIIPCHDLTAVFIRTGNNFKRT